MVFLINTRLSVSFLEKGAGRRLVGNRRGIAAAGFRGRQCMKSVASLRPCRHPCHSRRPSCAPGAVLRAVPRVTQGHHLQQH